MLEHYLSCLVFCTCNSSCPGAVHRLYSTDNVWWLFHYHPRWCSWLTCRLVQSERSLKHTLEKKREGVNKIMPRLIQRPSRAECASSGRIIYSIFSSLGSKKARRWHASRKLISPHAFHLSRIREKSWPSSPTCLFLLLLALHNMQHLFDSISQEPFWLPDKCCCCSVLGSCHFSFLS